MRSKIKILLLNNKIPHYRIPFFKMIDNNYDLTIIHEGPSLNQNFKQIIIPQLDYRLWKQYHATHRPHHLTITTMY